MPYKTILVHLCTEARAPGLLEAAVAVARKSDAHVVALHVIPRVSVPAVVPFEVTGEIVEIQQKALIEQASRVKKIYDEAMTQAPVRSEWRQVEAKDFNVAELVMQQGRTADLIVAAQPQRGLDAYAPTDVAEDVMMDAGRPVLLIPEAGIKGTIGKHALLAWNGSREAARAVFDALPLLEGADQVRIISVNPSKGASGTAEMPWAELAQMLSRHGIKAEATSSYAKHMTVTQELQSRIADHNADLLVMGGYGHSRLREVVFGGATRDMLTEMTVPILMSH